MGRALPSGVVTFVFTDIEGSTRLLSLLGDQYGDLLAAHHRLLREAWRMHGGQEMGTEGDAFFVVFADPGAAVRAVTEAQRRLGEHAWPSGQMLRVRMGVHSGVARIQDENYWGQDVHYAARIAAAASGGQVLVSVATRSLVRDGVFESLGEHRLKDFVDPRELFHLVIDGRRSDSFAPPRTLDRVRTNLPATVGDLIGRARELEDLAARCSNGDRLVTIVGPGGTGKTRLAVELGHRLAEGFDGVWFVSLDEVARSEDVVSAIAQTIGLPESPDSLPLDQLVEYLAERKVLLLLDNLEHVLEAAPAIERISLGGRSTHVLATSQTPLRVSGERVMRLEPLDLPEPDMDRDTIVAVPSVQMLLDRSAAAGVTLRVDEAASAGLVRLCQQLEGMPLAIELAAPRLGLLSPAALADRLARELDALGRGGRDLPSRQRGLRAMLEWTVGLLNPGARLLLAQLAAFPAGFIVELAEAAFGDVLEELMALLDVGLVRRSETDRLALRPPVRRFASEMLRENEGEQSAFAAAADAIAGLAERFERRWFVRAGEGRVLLSPEASNIAFLLDWTRTHDTVRHARLAAATGWWMNHSARTHYAREHLNVALERVSDPQLRARCLQALGTLGLAAVDPTESLRAAEAWHALGDVDGEVFSLLYAANLHTHRKEGDAAMRLVQRAEAAAAPVISSDEELRWSISMVRADALWHTHHRDEAETLLRTLFHQARPDSWRHFWAATKQADFALETHRAADALHLYGIAMRDLEGLSSPMGETIQADTIAAALLQLDRTADATDVYAICELAHTELAYAPGGALGEILAEVQRRIDPVRLPRARARASELGLIRGLAWVRRLALGELTGHDESR